MKNVTALLAAGFALALTAPAFAEEMDMATMTCADLAAMDGEGQMHTVELMETAAMEMAAAEGTEAMASEMTLEETTAAVMTACEGMADALVMDELHTVQTGNM